jgi:RNA polymerase sigma factor (sigma-70 family)
VRSKSQAAAAVAINSSTPNLPGPRASSGTARWEELIVRHHGQLRGRVRRTLRRAGMRPRADEVEELTQEVLCRLLSRGAHRLDACRGQSEGEIGSYLGRAAERVVYDRLRAARALKRGGATAGEAAAEDAEQVADPGGSPEELLLAAERRQHLIARCRVRAGLRCGRRGARVLELALLCGCSGAEIARVLGGELSARAVEEVLRELRRRLHCRRRRL